MAIQATYGTTISVGGTAIGEAISITPAQIKIGTIQTTNLADVGSTHAHTFIAGLEDAGKPALKQTLKKQILIYWLEWRGQGMKLQLL